MCGIAGIIDYNQDSTEEILVKITNELHHRGPDASGHQMFESEGATIGLGHRRLSVIDLSDSGRQPMQFGDLWITFNGEFYNYREIKNELISYGHIFVSGSDTEVILHAFSQWGISCVDKFIGMFAFVIYDTKSEVIYCVRDRPGIKPFFYYWHDGLFLFASELKAFHKHPKFKKEINFDAVAAFMQHGNVPTPHCIFQHTHKLRPGHFLKFNIKDRAFDIQKYWDVYDAYNKPKLDISFDDAKTETEKILKSAFEYRMVADVPVGVFLSGGYDSACLTAILQKDRTEKLKTFTIGVPDIGLNESEYAKNVANYLGTEHYDYSCTRKEALELISELPYHYDEPFGDQSAIPTMLLSKMTANEVTVALSADAGDEVFAGYSRYGYIMKHGNTINRIPDFVRKGISEMMSVISADHIPVMRNKYNFHNRYEKLKSLLKDPSAKNIMLSISQQFDEKEIKQLLDKSVKPLKTSHSNSGLLEEFYTPLAYMMAIDYQTFLLDDVLQKVDRASMAFSLESREPFTDHRIIEWAAQLPDHFKYNNGVKKYILKEIVHQYIPKKLMDRPKMGFQIPLEHWLSCDLKKQVMHYLNAERIASQGIFNPNVVQKLKDNFFSGKKEYVLKLWYLLMFQMWYEKWME
jgi:asparagine synthase (glutamine-hydrolysing)